MSVHTPIRTRTVRAEAAERTAVRGLFTEPEAAVSGAPVYAPEALLLLLAAVLLSPRQPKQPSGK
ncbi:MULTISPECIES: hypothetical protein [unclassified Streptomyces]|uniref:hypothetical protein n=1 Tax=unclassified Streptomyces TaxID=2593676 RepID=UPI0033C88A6B